MLHCGKIYDNLKLICCWPSNRRQQYFFQPQSIKTTNFLKMILKIKLPFLTHYFQRPAPLCVLRGAEHMPAINRRAQVPQPPEGHLPASLDHHPGGWQWPQAQPGWASGGGHGEEAQHHHVPVGGLPAPWCDRHPEVGGENEVWRIWEVRSGAWLQSDKDIIQFWQIMKYL